MKKIVIILIAISFFFSCDQEEKVPYNGYLKGEIKYLGASNMEIDNVIITLSGISDNKEEISKRITNDGKYDLELPAGTYTMELKGNRCISDDLPYTVKIVANQTRTKDINIEQLPYSLVITRNGIELEEASTIDLARADVLNIWNKYSSNTLVWEIESYPQPSWITFKETTGSIVGGGSYPIVYSIENNKMPNYGENLSDIILTAKGNNEGRGFKITIRAFKEGSEPEPDEFITLNSLGIMVQKQDITEKYGYGTTFSWAQGKQLVAESRVAGYSDWRLPRIDELEAMYDEQVGIGGFETGYFNFYWSSTLAKKENYYSNDTYLGIRFDNGTIVNNYEDYQYGKIRAVRSINKETNVQIRFKTEKSYLYIDKLAVELQISEILLASHNFNGIDAELSPYYQIPAGNHKILYHYTYSGEEGWYNCLPNTYNFQTGKKYTIVCSDDGTNLTFNVLSD